MFAPTQGFFNFLVYVRPTLAQKYRAWQLQRWKKWKKRNDREAKQNTASVPSPTTKTTNNDETTSGADCTEHRPDDGGVAPDKSGDPQSHPDAPNSAEISPKVASSEFLDLETKDANMVEGNATTSVKDDEESVVAQDFAEKIEDSELAVSSTRNGTHFL